MSKLPAIHVAILVYRHILATSLTLPVEMLRAGEAYARRHARDFRPLDIQLVASDKRPIESRAAILLTPDADVQSAHLPELVIVPSLWRNPRPVVQTNQPLVDWLNKVYMAKAHIIGVGTGNCFLAEAGLLDGHPATTHWHYAEQFKRDYPKVQLKPEFFITQSERLYSVASLNAQADVVVHIIEQYYGQAAARHVERNFSHEIRKPYAEQRFLEGAADRHPDELIAQIQFWMKTNLASEQSLAELAEQFGLSQRSFTRRFKAATDQTAVGYWQQLRLQAAKELLSSSNLSIQDVALEVGYSDQGQLTRVFKQYLQQTPSEYRAMVRRKLFGS